MEWPGNRRRVQQLVDAHYEPLFRYAFRLSGTAADAEDLTQEAFCKAQLQLHQLRDPARAKPWLFSILRNAYLHRVRSAAQHKSVSLEAIADLPGPDPDVPPEVEPAQLQAALNDLPEAFRTPVILFYFEDFSYRDIAEQMDLPIGTVMSRLARAKAHLRTRLRPAAPPAGREEIGPRVKTALPQNRETGERKGAIHGL
jgi:RNA polymerase sigma-70 factor (ECF subfamily)